MEPSLSPFVVSQLPYLTALLAGLFGGVHCLGMCGGIAGALVYGLPADVRSRPTALAPFVVAYNAGRVLSYACAGALAGWLGNLAMESLSAYSGWIYMRVVAAAFMIALGLYVGGWWFGLTRLERVGDLVWRHLRPLGQRLLNVQHPGHAVLVGVVWGWLPCGLVYAVLVWALAAGGWWQGAVFLLCFGIGTLPALFFASFTGAAAGTVLQRRGVRRAAGAMVVAFGILTLTATLVYRPNVGLGCAVPGLQ